MNADSTAKAFLNFFKSLPRSEREAVLARMVADEDLSEDISDMLISELQHQEDRHAVVAEGNGKK